MLEAASTALNTKFDVVDDPTVGAVPDNIAVPPSAAVFVKVIPDGKAPDCNSKVTFPADSGSVALTETLTDDPLTKLPNVPEAVVNAGD